MIIIDSSFWIELFAGTDLGKIIRDNNDFKNGNFIVPSIVITEVYKKLLSMFDSYTALLYTTQMQIGKIVNLDFELALSAAEKGKKFKLPLADSIIYATAIKYKVDLYTLDSNFENLENVKYFKK